MPRPYRGARAYGRGKKARSSRPQPCPVCQSRSGWMFDHCTAGCCPDAMVCANCQARFEDPNWTPQPPAFGLN